MINAIKTLCAAFFIAVLGFSTSAGLAYAQDGSQGDSRDPVDRRGVYSISFENDVFANTDRGYTNGVRFSYMTDEERVPGWVERYANQMPFFSSDGKKRASFAFGQSMFTPRDITRRELIVDDRPYAGWLYGTVGLISDNDRRLDNLQLMVGIVGPLSGAEQTQEFVHDNILGDDPSGWDNQLENEPGVTLFYERSWRNLYEISPFGYGVDFTPHAGFALGNVFTYAAAGGTFRLGFDLPSDYGPPRIRPSLPGSDFFIPTKDFSWYLFAGFEGRAVARNIFLDGNTFSDSHSVDREVFTGDIQMGLSVILYETRVSYTHTFRAQEFREQESNSQFGAITVSRRF